MQAATKKLKKAVSLFEEKKFPQAESLFREALSIQPASAEALYHLGIIFLLKGDTGNGMELLRNSLRHDPNHALSHYELGKAHAGLGNIAESIKHLMTAIKLSPDEEKYIHHFLTAVRPLRFHAANPELLELLSWLMVKPSVDGNSIMALWASLYHFSNGYAALEVLAEPNASFEDSIALHDPYLINALAYTTIQDVPLENLLTRIRAKLARLPELQEYFLPFLTALSLQGFANEYLWDISAEEEKRIIALEEKAKNGSITLPELLLFGAYRYLHILPNITDFKEIMLANDFGSAVWKRQVQEPLTENAIKPEITHLTPIENEISGKVQSQYEENPYPRWDTLDILPPMAVKDYMLRRFPQVSSDYFRNVPERPKILIAGCGTGRQVLSNANVFQNAQFTAVDLSLSSLGYAIRKQQEMLPKARVTWGQADILKLDTCFEPASFDIIECCGVLHHMENPLAGWEILAKLLKSKGLMKIALYSHHARQNINQIREKIASEKHPSTINGIRTIRHIVKEQIKTTQDFDSLLYSTDFYSTSGCRDLLFHVQEHQFTLPQIQDAIDRLGLSFIVMDLQNNKANAEFNASAAGKGHPTLADWDDYERINPGTFGGMYQFWLRKE